MKALPVFYEHLGRMRYCFFECLGELRVFWGGSGLSNVCKPPSFRSRGPKKRLQKKRRRTCRRPRAESRAATRLSWDCHTRTSTTSSACTPPSRNWTRSFCSRWESLQDIEKLRCDRVALRVGFKSLLWKVVAMILWSNPYLSVLYSMLCYYFLYLYVIWCFSSGWLYFMIFYLESFKNIYIFLNRWKKIERAI